MSPHPNPLPEGGGTQHAALSTQHFPEGEGTRHSALGTRHFRVGVGYDAHQLASGRRLVLGGVEVPHERGLAGHSDGDAITHAIIDALLGAAALGDIGQRFPSSDPVFENVSSLLLLARVCALLEQHGWRPGNVDATVVAERPRLAPHIREMRQRLAAALRLELEAVSVKATTTDRMGFTGREEGIAAFAVATIYPSPGAAQEAK